MSDHKERACQKCGSLLHHESDCAEDGMDDVALRELIATLRAELEKVKTYLKLRDDAHSHPERTK